MERYLLCSGHGPGHSQDKAHAAEQPKMALGPSSPPGSDLPSAQQHEEANDTDQAPWDSQQPSQANSQPLVDYKRLAIEVAMRIAPDLQETLETTVQSSLLKQQADIIAHAGRLLELEQRVSCLEDEKASMSTVMPQRAAQWHLH